MSEPEHMTVEPLCLDCYRDVTGMLDAQPLPAHPEERCAKCGTLTRAGFYVVRDTCAHSEKDESA